MEKREPSYTVGGNVNWYSHYGRHYASSSKNMEIEEPCDPAILLLGKWPDKTITPKDTCIPMLTAALFTAAKT